MENVMKKERKTCSMDVKVKSDPGFVILIGTTVE